MLPPYAKLLVRKNGGAPQTGAITCADGDSIQLTVEQPTAIDEYRWEIYGYPPEWTAPAGWTLDAASGAYVNTDSSPPSFTLSGWGKWMLRLVINRGVTRDVKNSPAVDQTTALEIVSPKGLHDIAPGEHMQFGGPASWVKDLQRNLRVIEEGLGEDPSSVELDGEVKGPAGNTVVGKIGGADVAFDHEDSGQLTLENGEIVAKAETIPDAADISFDPTGTNLAATKVQAAIVELDARPPASDATKIQGTDVSADPLLDGQTYVKTEAGILVPRFVSPSSDRLITAAGTVDAVLGENIYVDVASGDVDVKLPASPVIGSTVRVKRLSTNASLVTVDGNGSTIDGDSAVAIKPHEAALFRCYAAGKWARLGKCEAVSQGVVAHLGLEYDPIALWKLDGDLLDSSGYGRHLPSAYNSYGFTTATAGFTCVNVANGYFTASGNPAGLAPLFQVTDCTIQAIVNIVPGGERAIMSAHRGPFASIPHWRLAVSNTATIFTWRNSTDTALVTVSAPAIPVGEWVHLAATRRNVDGSMLARVYVNGAKVAESAGLALPLTTLASSWHFYMAATATAGTVGNASIGLIGSCKVNDFALTDAQVYAEAQRAKRVA